MTAPAALVAKVWNYAHVLRDQGVSYGDYLEQITYLLFLKMDQEREALIGEGSAVPAAYRWETIAKLDGEKLSRHYRDALDALGKETALYEAALGLMVRTKTWSALRAWGMKIAQRAGLKKAVVAVARRLAVIMLAMWRDGSDFRWGAAPAGQGLAAAAAP
jgi:type I restriction-modification system DNA methylase subunit